MLGLEILLASNWQGHYKLLHKVISAFRLPSQLTSQLCFSSALTLVLCTVYEGRPPLSMLAIWLPKSAAAVGGVATGAAAVWFGAGLAAGVKASPAVISLANFLPCGGGSRGAVLQGPVGCDCGVLWGFHGASHKGPMGGPSGGQ